MSGDVQPRKRKDKRRKKEGGSLGSIHEPITLQKFKRSESDDKKVFDLSEQGEKIHIQIEHGVGGNICVKIVFFCLFGLLIGAVGLIYMKSLGSTDVDLPTIEESRFAEYFTGWLDESSDDHEHEAVEDNLDHDHDEHDEGDHDDEHADHEEDDEHENEEEQEDAIYKLFGLGNNEVDETEDDIKEDVVRESKLSGIRPDVDEDQDEENEEEEEEEEKHNDSEEAEESAEEEEKEEDDSGISLEEEDQDQDDENDEDGEDDEDLSQEDEEDEEMNDASQAEESEESEGRKENLKDEDEDEDEDDENEDEDEKSEIEDDNKNVDLIEEQLDSYNNDDEDEEEYTEELKEEREDKKEEDISNEHDENDDLGFEEIDVSEEDLEENEQKINVEELEFKKKSRKHLVSDNEEEIKITKEQPENEEEEAELESGRVAVKLGVGIALIIVAHLVLVKKWKSMNKVSTDEIVSPEIKENKEIEKLHSSVEPVISRRQTLVPENVYLNDEADEEETEDEEEEDEEDEENDDDDDDEDEVYSEHECEEEEFKKSESDNLQAFEKLSWNIKKSKNENRYGNEINDNKDIAEEEEEEEEYEEDEEIDEEEEEEEEENDDEEEEEEDENDFVKQKIHTTTVEEMEEEIDNATPIPPPRSKTGRGAQDIDEEGSIDFSKVEETNEDGSKGDDINNSGPEEQKTPDKKVGNEDEWAFRQELDFADEQLENNPKAAVEAYDKIISKKPIVIRALVGRAKALDHWAEKEKSNAYLKQAINAYKTLLLNHGHLLDDETYVKLAERCIERMRFSGAFVSAIDIHKALILKYPNTPKYRNTLAVTYLMLNKIPQARVLLNETLTMWPNDGFALVHYGFILKTSDNNMEEGAKKLMAGIQTKQEGVIDGMFFFHLGDALNRLGRGKEAMEWYELGVKQGLFLNKYQRSLYNVNRLKGQPWWTKEETTYQDFFKKLEENWREIRREGLELLNFKGINLFKEEAENLKDTGDWKQLDLYFRGRKQPNCYKAPLTCSLVSSFKPASTCTRGQIKFSVMLPNTHVWPHCGPTNCRLRSHLGLVVPKKTFIRVAEETRSWEEGKFIIFDDSFEHEVWHNGTGLRLVLIVDVWHPELTNQERRSLSPI